MVMGKMGWDVLMLWELRAPQLGELFEFFQSCKNNSNKRIYTVPVCLLFLFCCKGNEDNSSSVVNGRASD